MPPPDDIERQIDEARTLHGYFGSCFNSEGGRHVLEFLKARNHVYDGQLHQPGDPYETAFRDGRRAAVIDILNMLEPFDPKEMRKRLQDARPGDPFAMFSRD